MAPPLSPFIITAADVRVAIKLSATRFDPVIETGIATIGIDLEMLYSRSLRVGSAPEGSKPFFISKVARWATEQPDIDMAIGREAASSLTVA